MTEPTEQQLPWAKVSGPLHVITEPAEVQQAAERLAEGTGPIAVDAERANGFRYSSRAYLIQLYRRGSGTVLIDPPAAGSLLSVQEAIGDDEWVIHAASQDLPSLREAGLSPRSLFDTELGARLAGFERVGLAAVVERLLGLRLKKEHGASDWSKRPLPEDWLTYAALDVELLVDVRDALAAELDSQEKAELAREEFAYELTKRPKEHGSEAWRRLSGIQKLRNRKQLAVARELWLARDAIARERDVAPGKLIPDASLIVAASSDATSKGQLAGIREFHGRASRTELDRWWAAIEAGRAAEALPPSRLPAEGPPPPRFWSSKRPIAAARLQAAKSAIDAVATEMRMAPERVLTPDTLRRLVWDSVDTEVPDIASELAARGVRSWQIDAVAQVVARSFVEGAQASEDSTKSPS